MIKPPTRGRSAPRAKGTWIRCLRGRRTGRPRAIDGDDEVADKGARKWVGVVPPWLLKNVTEALLAAGSVDREFGCGSQLTIGN